MLTIAVTSWSPGSVGGELPEAEEMLHPEEESRTADAADQNRHLHTARHYARRRRPSRE